MVLGTGPWLIASLSIWVVFCLAFVDIHMKKSEIAAARHVRNYSS